MSTVSTAALSHSAVAGLAGVESVSRPCVLGASKDAGFCSLRRCSPLNIRTNASRHVLRAKASGQTDDDIEAESDRKTLAPLSNPVQKLATSAVTLLAVGALLLVPAGDALAAKSGGRVGGSQFRSSAPREAPRVAPRINNSRTNIYVSPPAPPIFGGYGYSPFPFGGYGWSPFSYGPTIAVGGGFGFFSFILFLFVGGFIFNVVRGLFGRRDRDDDMY